jgi:hypothetical protein
MMRYIRFREELYDIWKTKPSEAWHLRHPSLETVMIN